MRRLTFGGVHAPACASFDDHVACALAEYPGFDLLTFVDHVCDTWDEERLEADRGDAAVIAYWRQVEADFQRSFERYVQ